MPNSKRFILTGSSRAGTKWMSRMLNQHPEATVTHDTILTAGVNEWPNAFTEWMKLKTPIVGMVSGGAWWWMDKLVKHGEFKWAFMWREPLAHARSAVQHNKRIKRRPIPTRFNNAIRHVALQQRGYHELMLRMAEKLGIKASHWHMEHYTTPKGFKALTEWLGMPFEPKWMKPANVGIKEDVRKRMPLDKLRAELMPLLELTPMVNAAYKEAKARMSGDFVSE